MCKQKRLLSILNNYGVFTKQTKANPNVKGLSQINIRYTERFYTMY